MQKESFLQYELILVNRSPHCKNLSDEFFSRQELKDL